MCLNICNTISNLSANLTLCSVAIVTAANYTPSSVAKKRDANFKNIALAPGPGAGRGVELNKPKFNTEFIEWFVGLCDAESNFLIRVRKDKLSQIKGFEFIFRIALHIDDIEVLKYIQTTLKCGIVQLDRNTYVLRISKLEDIKHILFQIFDLFPLNTKKHLDYLDFKKAYFMYVNRKNLNKQVVFADIADIKNSMNDQRTIFNLPENHVINITGNYLVGLLEGDGSFYLSKQHMVSRVSLITITLDKTAFYLQLEIFY